MSKLLQLRNVPSALHREIKSIAAREGRTMSEVGIEALEIIARQKSLRQAFKTLRQYPPIDSKLTTAELVRLERDSR
jgi:hypothetical protein